MPISNKPIRVIHVDDEPALTDVTAQYLERKSDRIEVTTATSAKAGLSIIETSGVDCVVSDYEMPGTGGIEFLRRVREEYPDLPFVLFTGKGSETIASEAISAGVTDYLQKETGTEQYELLANRIENAVSEYRATEIAERYETVIEALGYPVYVVDETGAFRFVNEPFAEMTGYDVEEIVGSEPALIKDEATVERAETELGRLLSSEGPETTRFEARIQPAEGDQITCRDHMGVLPYEGEEFRGSVGILRDISEERSRKHELTRYERIVRAAGDPVFSTDADGQLTFVNGAFEDMIGREAATLEGEPIADVAAGDHASRIERAIEGLLGADDPGRSALEIEIETADGDTIPTEVALTLLPGENGTRGTTGIVRDVTERKRRERKLRRRSERFETVIDIMDHDLLNQLNAATAGVDLLKRSYDGPEVDTVERALDRIEELVDRGVTLARTGRIVDDPKEVSVADAAREAWDVTDPDCSGLEIRREPGTVTADVSRYRQLLENLFHNAIDHAGDDPSVWVGSLDDGRGFYVADDGPGIPADGRETVFERGYTTEESGSGFGLSIVAEIAEAHGWDVTVTESQAGGARFEFRTDRDAGWTT